MCVGGGGGGGWLTHIRLLNLVVPFVEGKC